MEEGYSDGATAGVRKVGVEGPTKHVAVMSVISNQPQVRLQVEESLRAGGAAWVGGSSSSSLLFAATNEQERVAGTSQMRISKRPKQLLRMHRRKSKRAISDFKA